MEKKTQEKFGKLLKEFKMLKKRIAKDRDKLWDLYSEIEDIARSVDDGVDDIDRGLKFLQDGLDNMSEYL